MSDRERASFRGPVKSCFQEYEYRGPNSSVMDKHSTETTYDLEGRLLTTRRIHPDRPEWVSRRTYDEAGLLTKVSSGKSGQFPNETVYSYDEKGRVKEVRRTNDEAEDSTRKATGGNTPVKAAIVVTQFSGDPPTGEIFSVYFPTEKIPAPPPGGKVIVHYDDVGQRTELSCFDRKGRLTTKVVRTSDANGRIIEETASAEYLAQYFLDKMPAEQKEKIGEEGMYQAMRLHCGGEKATGASYSYDEQGRLVQVRRSNWAVEQIMTVSYNEHGDKSEERATVGPSSVSLRRMTDRSREHGTPIPDFPPIAERPLLYLNKYEYRGYDEYENWTELTKVERMGVSNFYRRTLTYH